MPLCHTCVAKKGNPISYILSIVALSHYVIHWNALYKNKIERFFNTKNSMNSRHVIYIAIKLAYSTFTNWITINIIYIRNINLQPNIESFFIERIHRFFISLPELFQYFSLETIHMRYIPATRLNPTFPNNFNNTHSTNNRKHYYFISSKSISRHWTEAAGRIADGKRQTKRDKRSISIKYDRVHYVRA